MSTLRKLVICTSFVVLALVGTGMIQLPQVRHDSVSTSVVTVEPVAAPVYQVQDITTANLQWYADVVALPEVLQQWNTTATDPTATWPDATDPTWKLPLHAQEQLACVRYHESRNHLNSVETQSMAEGWYQFTPEIWAFARQSLKGLPATPLQASGDQQSEVAVWYYLRNNGLHPEWDVDNC
jgi:hypothetical protein